MGMALPISFSPVYSCAWLWHLLPEYIPGAGGAVLTNRSKGRLVKPSEVIHATVVGSGDGEPLVGRLRGQRGITISAIEQMPS
jgi:hypothetical protein